jgi:putative SOS response-associated peptidase YedK
VQPLYLSQRPAAVLDLARVMASHVGNLEPCNVHLDYATGRTVEEDEFKHPLRMEPDSGTTNIRTTSSQHWQRWLDVEHRCVVPATTFSEYGKERAPDGTLLLH